MSDLTIAETLKYANLQMAAEAFLKDPASKLESYSGDALIKVLKTGNGHASRFTGQQAEDFADPVNGWTVLAQQINTPTGFSGTLFKNNKTDELVLSFRSTEFVDDAVRDNLATNTLEIKDTGWAWGQIRDMESWYSSLTGPGGFLSGGQQVTVTGYSLGGHLATTFNLLHGSGAVKQVVTFNGAGVGLVDNGHTLSELVKKFKDLTAQPVGSQPTELEKAFTDQDMKALYVSIRDHLNDHSWTLDQANAALDNYLTESGESTLPLEGQWLRAALAEGKALAAQNQITWRLTA